MVLPTGLPECVHQYTLEHSAGAAAFGQPLCETLQVIIVRGEHPYTPSRQLVQHPSGVDFTQVPLSAQLVPLSRSSGCALTPVAPPAHGDVDLN